MCWGIDNNLTRKLAAADPVQIAMLKGLIAGFVNLLIAIGLGAILPSIATAVLAGSVGFVGYGVSLALFVLGLRYLGTARTGAYFSMAPFVGAVLALVILHEPLSVSLLIAGVFMGAGLWLHLTERHEHEHFHEEVEHEHNHVHDDMNMDRMIRPWNLTHTGIGMPALCTTTRTIRTFIIGTSTPAKVATRSLRGLRCALGLGQATMVTAAVG
jgi:hypothetical protein